MLFLYLIDGAEVSVTSAARTTICTIIEMKILLVIIVSIMAVHSYVIPSRCSLKLLPETNSLSGGVHRSSLLRENGCIWNEVRDICNDSKTILPASLDSENFDNAKDRILDEALSEDEKITGLSSILQLRAISAAAPMIGALLVGLLAFASNGFALDEGISMSLFDPSNFQPVCPTSDQFYQFTKAVATALVGQENIVQYGPLIASVLLRIRLELCVFESFLYEAVVPFVQQKGLSWILPLHETLETFLAGTIFAVASNFILLGSTKIIAVILIYFDAIFGFPLRFIGSNMKKWSKKDSGVGYAGTALNIIGDILRTVRKTMEAIDTFVGRYLVFATSAYVIFKFAHFKLFNGFPPF